MNNIERYTNPPTLLFTRTTASSSCYDTFSVVHHALVIKSSASIQPSPFASFCLRLLLWDSDSFLQSGGTAQKACLFVF